MKDIYDSIKADVLAGMSGYAACTRHREDPLKWAKRLSTDPDIVKAKADGSIPDRSTNTKSPQHYRKMPCVIDVLDNGMTRSAAAAKHGVSQPYVTRCVQKAQAAPTTSAPAPQSTPQPAPAPSAPPQPSRMNLVLLSRAVIEAIEAGHTKEQVLNTVLASLPIDPSAPIPGQYDVTGHMK